MAPQPTGDATLTDKDLDEAVESMFDEATRHPPSPRDCAREPVPVETVVEPDTAQPDRRPGRRRTPGCRSRRPDPSPSQQRARSPAGGETVPVQGIRDRGRSPCAHELPDGSVVIPKDAPHRVPPRPGSRRDLQANFTRTKRESDRKIRDAQTQRTAKDAEADAVIAWGAELAQKTPEELWQHLNEFQGNVPRYQLDLERRRLDEQRKQFELAGEGPAVERGGAARAVHGERAGRAGSDLRVSRSGRRVQGIDAEDKQTLRARWEKRPELLVRRATEDMPQHGITKGDVLFDPSNLLDDAKFILAHRKPVAATEQGAAQNAIKNADRSAGDEPDSPNGAQCTTRGAAAARQDGEVHGPEAVRKRFHGGRRRVGAHRSTVRR
jgi:hypothetical protein